MTYTMPASPWNPIVILVLGIVFSPIWAGIMAAINGRRLGLALPIWRPIVIGVGSLVLDLGLKIEFSSLCVDLLLYLGALAIIWLTDLRTQFLAYQRPRIDRGEGGWLAPVLAGAPIAFLTFLVFMVGLLEMVIPTPLEPQQVCEQYLKASSEQEAQKYTTNNLWPALRVLKPNGAQTGSWEYMGEDVARSELGGGVLLYYSPDGRHLKVFHLVQRDQVWKIEDIIIPEFDAQSNIVELYVLPRDYHRLELAQAGEKRPAVDPQQKSWWDDPKNRKMAMKTGGKAAGGIAKSPEAKGFAKMVWAIVVAIFVGIGAFLKSLFRGTKEAAKDGVQAGTAAYQDTSGQQ